MSVQLALLFSPPLTSSSADSPAKTCPSLATAPASGGGARACGSSTSGSSKRSARGSSSSRTSLDSYGGVWTSYVLGSPIKVSRWKSPASVHPTSGARIDANECSSWPTLTAGTSGSNLRQAVKLDWPTPTAKGNHNKAGLSPASGDGLSTAVVKDWATPTARDWKSGSHGTQGNSRPLSEQIGLDRPGPLNPEWVETLMMFPTGWTDIPPAGASSSIRGSRRERRTRSSTVPPG